MSEKPVIVSEEVSRLLGDEMVQSFVMLARTKNLECKMCQRLIRHDDPDPVTMAVATFLAERGEPRRIEVLITHQHCADSKVVALDIPYPGADVIAGVPPAISLIWPSGRTAVIFERGVVARRRPLDGFEPTDSWVHTCLEAGLHLVLDPVEEFERVVDGWNMRIDDPALGLEVQGRGEERLRLPHPLPGAFVDVIARERRCTLITGSALLSTDVYHSAPAIDGHDLLAQLDEARRDGRLVGGVVEVVLAGARMPDQGQNLRERRRPWRGWFGRRRRAARPIS